MVFVQPRNYTATATDVANEAARLAMIAKRNRKLLSEFDRRKGSRSRQYDS